MSARILVTDDDAAIRAVIREALRRAGYAVEVAASLAEQRRLLARLRPHLLVTDVVLPDGDGLEAITGLRVDHPTLPIIVLSAQNTFMTAMRAADRGAVEYLPKPFDLDDLLRAVRQALANDALPDLPSAAEALPLVGRSAPMQEVYRTITRVVANDLTVLVLGDSGTGKALVARAIHDFGPRREGPFVAANLGAIPADLIGRELFGEVRGGLTPTATPARTSGRLEQARGGTLFLDEVGDLPLDAQTRLLSVLQSGEFTPLGANRAVRVDVRIVAATHQDLPRLIAEGAFREDLYYRLNVFPIRLPPLRDRPGDIAELARHFLGRAAADGLPRRQLDAAAVARLEQHGWPGNVRELENLMRRLAALSRETAIGAAAVQRELDATATEREPMPAEADQTDLADALEQHIAAHFARFGPGLPPDGLYERVLAEVERPLLRLALAAVRGNQLRAAKLLGLNRNTLRKKLTDHGVGPPVRGGN